MWNLSRDRTFLSITHFTFDSGGQELVGSDSLWKKLIIQVNEKTLGWKFAITSILGYPGSRDANISSMEEAGEYREMKDIPWKKATEQVSSTISDRT